MPTLADIRSYLTVTQIVAYALLLRKLSVSHLLKTYRYFSCLIAVETARLLFMSSLTPRSETYAHAYFITTPIIWVLYVLVVLELFQLTLRNHIGIASLGRKAVTTGLVVSVLVSSATLLFDLQRNIEGAFLFNFMLLERMVMTSLLVLLLCLIGFVSYFPVPLSRNIRTHACIFAVYFTVRTLLLFIRLWFGLEVVVALNVIGAVLATACLFTWTVLLSEAGEALPARHIPSSSEERLLAQLEAINDSLLRSARK